MPDANFQLNQILNRKAPVRGTGAQLPGRATIAGPKPADDSGRRWPRAGWNTSAKTVDAVAQAGRLRPVVEDVAEMAAAAAAMHFGAQHAEGAVLGLADRVFERLVEARPAGAALEFRLGGEQRQVAAGAGEDALAMLLEQRAGARPLGALLAQDLILLRRQLRAPFGVGLFDLEFLARPLRRRRARSQRKAARPNRPATDASRIRRSIMVVSVRSETGWFAAQIRGLTAEVTRIRAGFFSLSCEVTATCVLTYARVQKLPRRRRFRRRGRLRPDGRAADGGGAAFRPGGWLRPDAPRVSAP